MREREGEHDRVQISPSPGRHEARTAKAHLGEGRIDGAARAWVSRRDRVRRHRRTRQVRRRDVINRLMRKRAGQCLGLHLSLAVELVVGAPLDAACGAGVKLLYDMREGRTMMARAAARWAHPLGSSPSRHAVSSTGA